MELYLCVNAFPSKWQEPERKIFYSTAELRKRPCREGLSISIYYVNENQAKVRWVFFSKSDQFHFTFRTITRLRVTMAAFNKLVLK